MYYSFVLDDTTMSADVVFKDRFYLNDKVARSVVVCSENMNSSAKLTTRLSSCSDNA